MGGKKAVAPAAPMCSSRLHWLAGNLHHHQSPHGPIRICPTCGCHREGTIAGQAGEPVTRRRLHSWTEPMPPTQQQDERRRAALPSRSRPTRRAALTPRSRPTRFSASLTQHTHACGRAAVEALSKHSTCAHLQGQPRLLLGQTDGILQAAQLVHQASIVRLQHAVKSAAHHGTVLDSMSALYACSTQSRAHRITAQCWTACRAWRACGPLSPPACPPTPLPNPVFAAWPGPFPLGVSPIPSKISPPKKQAQSTHLPPRPDAAFGQLPHSSGLEAAPIRHTLQEGIVNMVDQSIGLALLLPGIACVWGLWCVQCACACPWWMAAAWAGGGCCRGDSLHGLSCIAVNESSSVWVLRLTCT